VVLDHSLIQTVPVTHGLKKGGTVLINGKNEWPGWVRHIGNAQWVYLVDASDIAVRHGLGSSANPIVNTAILGAFAKAAALVGLDAVETAIREHVPLKKEANIAAAREAFRTVVQVR
jgi:2-oxoacid:acceptor oxidoreductase gamma subunit (pyruvate/2-ketoisovalerate family)